MVCTSWITDVLLFLSVRKVKGKLEHRIKSSQAYLIFTPNRSQIAYES